MARPDLDLRLFRSLGGERILTVQRQKQRNPQGGNASALVTVEWSAAVEAERVIRVRHALEESQQELPMDWTCGEGTWGSMHLLPTHSKLYIVFCVCVCV
jgi:hypothetical protein